MLFADATALIALGALGRVSLLQYYDPPVVIGSVVNSEVRRSQPQIMAARSAGWLRVEMVDQTEISTVEQGWRLDAGEAETVALAGALGGRNDTVLIDEGRAFRLVDEAIQHNRLPVKLVCLAQVLHHLEENGSIPSALEIFQPMIDEGHYGWAPNVRRHYEGWCRRYDKTILPANRDAG